MQVDVAQPAFEIEVAARERRHAGAAEFEARELIVDRLQQKAGGRRILLQEADGFFLDDVRVDVDRSQNGHQAAIFFGIPPRSTNE